MKNRIRQQPRQSEGSFRIRFFLFGPYGSSVTALLKTLCRKLFRCFMRFQEIQKNLLIDRILRKAALFQMQMPYL